MEDVFAIQDEIARAIAETLKVRLLPADEARSPRPRNRGRRGLQRLPEGPLLLQPAAARRGDRRVRAGDRARPALRRGVHGPRRLLLHLGLLRRDPDAGSVRAGARGRREGAGARAGLRRGPRLARPRRALLRLGHSPARSASSRRAIEAIRRSADGYFWLGAVPLRHRPLRRGAGDGSPRPRARSPTRPTRGRPLGWAFMRARGASRRRIPELREGRGRSSPTRRFHCWSLG